MFKFGIMGAGGIAARFCRVVSSLNGVSISAVSSKDKARAEKFARENNIPSYYDSYEQMLCNAEIDAVYIATTNNFHYENTLLCLNHNIPVLCEKPFAMTEREAAELFAVAEKKNIFVMEAMWSNLLPSTLKAKELIGSGTLGEIVSADFNFGFKSNSSHRVLNPAIGGGALYDVGVYGIEILTHLISKPVDEVIPSITFNHDKIDTTDHIVLRMGSCLAHIHSSVSVNLRNDAYIYGTEGMLHMENAFCCRKFTVTPNKGTTVTYTFDFNDGFEFEIEETIRCIKAKVSESPMITHHQTIRCAAVFDLCLNRGHQ